MVVSRRDVQLNVSSEPQWGGLRSVSGKVSTQISDWGSNSDPSE